eukprot:360674-Chlamydomonas_euryale.AAC.6
MPPHSAPPSLASPEPPPLPTIASHPCLPRWTAPCCLVPAFAHARCDEPRGRVNPPLARHGSDPCAMRPYSMPTRPPPMAMQLAPLHSPCTI